MSRTLLFCLLLLPCVVAEAQWTERTTNTTSLLSAVHFVNDTGYVVGYDGTVLRSTDQGLNWTPMGLMSMGFLRTVWFLDGLHGYVAGDNGIFRTANGGATWETVNTPVQVLWRCLVFRTPQLGFCGGGNDVSGTIMRTLDGGNTWDVVYSVASMPISSIDVPSDDIVYAAPLVYGSALLRSADGGNSWNSVPDGLMSELEAIHFTDANTGYAGGRDLPSFIRTDDGGSIWAPVLSSMNFDLLGLAFASPQQGLAVGDNAAIYHTYNGSDWVNESWPDPILSFYAADMLNDSTAIVVGDIGTLLRWGSVTAGVPAIAQKSVPITVHPSPATDWLILDTETPLPADARFELLDVRGSVVMDAAAKANARMELAGIPTGNYVWRCELRGNTLASGTVVLAR